MKNCDTTKMEKETHSAPLATSRRDFVRAGATLLGSALLGGPLLGQASLAAAPRQGMTMDLNCGRIGVEASQLEAIELASRYGFESVAPQLDDLSELSEAGRQRLLADLDDKGLVFSATGLPVDFRSDEETFRQTLKQLPTHASTLQKANVTRITTWIMPAHATLTYLQNFKRHVRRLQEIADVLGNFDLQLGLEYVGPKTSWTSKKYPFVHTLAETKELIAEIGAPNVGFVLDSWHWYTAGESGADLLTLEGEDVVAVDLNDAPVGIPVDQQKDLRREVPMATGVIDARTFLTALQEIGYTGPVRAEPFNEALNDLPSEKAVAVVSKAMKEAFALIR